MSIESLIDNVKDGNNVEASKVFNSLMADKMSAALEAEKINVASSLITRKSSQEEE